MQTPQSRRCEAIVAGGLQAKRELVAGVVSRLGLPSCRNTRIGSVLSRGISGGEVRRTLLRVCVCQGKPAVTRAL